MPRLTTVTKMFELHELFLSCFFVFVELKKKKKIKERVLL